jgi:acyl-CoA reductase-like NAD-dependent aldehyde dehydrogenase
MKLYVGTMDAVVVDVDADGRVRLENEDWSQPTLQERRAILHAAQEELLALGELIEILQADRCQSVGLSSAIRA